MSMAHQRILLVLAFSVLLRTTLADYVWTGTEWKWAKSEPMSYDDEDFRAGSGDEEDDYDYGEKEGQRKEGEEHEPPFGAIQKMTVLADQTTITINWQPPERETWNSCLLGYRVGIRRKNSSDPISFELVEGKYEDKETGKDFFFEEVEGTNHTHVFPNLDFETTYVVAVQVFNPWGKNPELEETEATTLPGRPAHCTSYCFAL